jgi:hypothetical protein
MMTGKGYFEKFGQELSKLTDIELVDKFNQEVDTEGWGTARASYLAAIHQEFNKRRFDYSEIGNEHELSFKNKIELKGKVIFKVS